MANVTSWINPARANIIADFWNDFEFSATAGTMTTAQLDGSTHGTDPTWGFRGANNWFTLSNGEKNMISPVNSLIDHGTSGLGLAADGSTFQSVQGAFTPVNKASLGVWFFFPLSISADSTIDIIQFSNAGGDLLMLTRLMKASGVYSIHGIASGMSTDIVIAQLGAWYWVTMTYTSLGFTAFNVYDVNGIAIGSSSTVDAVGHQVGNIRIGPDDTAAAITPVNVYWDDVVVDYTNAVFPLGP